jgi:hypothetical protein
VMLRKLVLKIIAIFVEDPVLKGASFLFSC